GDRASLVARRTVGLVEGNVLAVGRLLPELDDLAEDRLRRRIGDEGERRPLARCAGDTCKDTRGDNDDSEQANSSHEESLSLLFAYRVNQHYWEFRRDGQVPTICRLL